MTFEDVIAEPARALAHALGATGVESLRVATADFEIEVSRRIGTPEQSAEREASATPDADRPPPDYDVLTADVVGRVRFLRPTIAVGTQVEGDRDLGFIETLGIRNPIRSLGPGRVAVIYVEEGQAVDYGAPLFAIDRSVS